MYIKSLCIPALINTLRANIIIFVKVFSCVKLIEKQNAREYLVLHKNILYISTHIVMDFHG